MDLQAPCYQSCLATAGRSGPEASTNSGAAGGKKEGDKEGGEGTETDEAARHKAVNGWNKIKTIRLAVSQFTQNNPRLKKIRTSLKLKQNCDSSTTENKIWKSRFIFVVI